MTRASDKINITVRNFGPIESAAVALNDLTIFVGANNAGKSYLAAAIYVLASFASDRLPFGQLLDPIVASIRNIEQFPAEQFFSQEAIDEFREWVATDSSAAASISTAHYSPSVLPSSVLNILLSRTKAYMKDGASKDLSNRFTRAFGCEFSEFVGASNIDFSLTAMQNQFETNGPGITMSAKGLSYNPDAFDWDQISKQNVNFLLGFDRLRTADNWRELLAKVQFEAVGTMLLRALRSSIVRTYYLPAARSGILLSERAILRSGLEALAGQSDAIPAPKLAGIIIDFVQWLATEPLEHAGPLLGLAEKFQEEMIHGIVEVKRSKQGNEFFYKKADKFFPLRRTSSMIQEVAPLIVLTRHLLTPQSLVIIEEPESHLHPRNQVRLAEFLVTLVNAGVKVLLTTHSDFFLAQLNLLMLQHLRKPADAQVPQLDRERVAAYMFHPQDYGTKVTELEITEDEGISRDGFQSVGDELYEKRVALEYPDLHPEQ